MSEIIRFIVETISAWGYLGIFLMMFLESSFFPFPSEIVMIPAGYLAYKGDMNIYFAIVMGILGSITGGLFNYYLALKLGRSFIIAYGKYFFFSEKSMKKMEDFFKKHGEISTFLGRLIPALRQYISLPAGLAKMNLLKFCIYTGLGAGIWVTVLTGFGYYLGTWIGENINTQTIIEAFSVHRLTNDEINIKSYLHHIVLITLGIVFLIALIYIFYQLQKRRK
ncbi:DedA family protein [Helicobacter sp. 11S03491-1]|uniref:DedA family protein n=1 Tax=Helicobacter sp. 11S03491-1 TaxID=1476196 RepID=UPI000BDBD798|nr:DedA family protein [Helicobacter sp. 11S03491-1]PAF41464.1 alkaline phosphatase [Helicobacter sp. 11S03491-1]